MKLYHDADEDDSWTEVGDVVEYPTITTRNNMYGLCDVKLRDFEGALYSTWYSRDFCPMRVEDDDENVIFDGYLAKKNFTAKYLMLHLVGFGVRLEWASFNSNYILAEGKVQQVDADAELHVYYDENENNEYDAGGDEDFDWDDDQWVSGQQDKGLLIVDNTTSTISKEWDASAVDISGEDSSAGNAASTITKDDDDELVVTVDGDNNQTYATSTSFTIDGTVIPDTHSIQKIEIDYQYGFDIPDCDPYSFWYLRGYLQIKKDADWITLKTLEYSGKGPTKIWTDSPLITIEESATEMAKYFNTAGGNFTELKGLRIYTRGQYITMGGYAEIDMECDYIKVTVYHNTLNISPIMESITDSAANSLTCAGVTWTNTGVAVNDSFKIGQNTNTILSDIASQAGVPLNIVSTLSKYIARHFKGLYCISALTSVCQVEGAIWCEDHATRRIKIVKPDDFVDSGVDLTVSDADWDWDLEDACNQVKRVEVWGNAAYNIFSPAEDFTVSGNITKIIIDNTIMTKSDAQEVANTQLDYYKDKRPSMRLSLNGTRTAIQLGTTVDITFARPTIAKATYPIRMIERKPRGIDGIQTIIHAGLGETEWDEKLGMAIRRVNSVARKNLSDRLVSTPWAAGAIITYGDIVGFGTGVRDIIDAEIVDGEAIDAAIDALIATHTADDNAHHEVFENLVEDVTPQLGGDLDLNEHNIDFPSTPNISDCLDEDNMGSNSATKLATQQSIKAYADAKVSDAVYDADNWNGVTTIAPSKNAVRDVVVTLAEAVVYKGTYTPGDAYPAAPENGDFYICDDDGYKAAPGGADNTPARWYELGDWIVWNNTTSMWDTLKNSMGDNVIAVNPGDDIQVAIDEVESIGRGVIKLLPGTHTLTATLTIDNANVNIIIDGIGATIDCAGDRSAFDIDNAASCILMNFSIDASDVSTQAKIIIDINEANDNLVICENLTITGDADKKGYGIIGLSDCIVRNCEISYLYIGVYPQGGKCKVYENHLHHNGHSGIISAHDNHSIFDNDCHDNATTGIYLYDACYNTVSDNRLDDNGIGILIAADSDFNFVTSNKCYSNTSEGIRIDDGDYNTIIGNQLLSNDIGLELNADAQYNMCVTNVFNGNNTDISDNSDGSNYIVDPLTDLVVVNVPLYSNTGTISTKGWYLEPTQSAWGNFYISNTVDSSKNITITLIFSEGDDLTIDGQFSLVEYKCDGTTPANNIEAGLNMDITFAVADTYIDASYTWVAADILTDASYLVGWVNDDGANDIYLVGIQVEYYVKKSL
ncbi:MAG: nitrous oxide reductase family maturation protein NosD [Promethearchaeota archaeon]